MESTVRGVCQTLDVGYVGENKDIIYRVFAGTYSNKNNAEGFIKELKNKGYDVFVSIHSV